MHGKFIEMIDLIADLVILVLKFVILDTSA